MQGCRWDVVQGCLIRTCPASPHRLTWSAGCKTQQQMATNSTDVAVVDRYVLDDCHRHNGTLRQRCGTLILLKFSKTSGLCCLL